MVDGPVLNLEPIMSPVSLALDAFPQQGLLLRLSRFQMVPLGNSFYPYLIRGREVDSEIRYLLKDPPCQLSIHHNFSLFSLPHRLIVNMMINGWVFESQLSKLLQRDMSLSGEPPKNESC